jgi:hypothetical integral membrane protein (TIGR02206 family)
MKYFLDTVETVAPDVGFSAFDGLHLFWLALFNATVIANCVLYHKMGELGRMRWRRIVAILVVLDEIFKMAMLTIGRRYTLGYLPLHLCSINIFLIAIHAWRPSDTLGSFLYTVCIPGALAALLFPTWTSLPFGNFMHMHSFTVHILLALYPIVLAVGGDIKVSFKLVPKCLLLLVAMAIPIYIFNLIFDTNYMFLMQADPGNPLQLFEQLWGNHLYGFPVLIAAIVLVMYLPVEIYRKAKAKKLN